MSQLSWLMPNNEKYSEVNLSTSISTLCRDLSDTNPIMEVNSIVSLEHLRDLYEEEKRDPKNKKNGFKKLNKADQIRAQNSEKIITELQKKSKITLDNWQKTFLKELDTENSIIVCAPTGTGKTYTSVKAFMSVLERSGKTDTIVYIAPYFYLAFQMLANIRKMTSKDVNFITEHYKQITKECNVYIGTSKELFTHFRKNNETFETGIFDEIHSISSTYIIGNGDRERAENYTGLVGLCKKKIIGLSASVKESDVENLIGFLSKTSGISQMKFKKIIHTQRTVPLYKHIFTTRGIKDVSEKTEYPEKTPFQYMKCFLDLKKKNWLPLLCFQENNIITWKEYEKFVDFLRQEEEKESKVIIELAEHFNPIIDPVIKELETVNIKIQECSVSNSDLKDRKGSSKDVLTNEKLLHERSIIVEKLNRHKEIIIQRYEKEFMKLIDDFVEDKFESNYIDDSLTDVEKKKMENYVTYTYQKIMKTEIEFDECFFIPYFTYFFKVIDNLLEMEELTYLPTDKNPYFVFGKVAPDLGLYKVLKNVGGIVNEEINKKRKSITLLSKSEGYDDVKSMYDILDKFIKGLEYGIGILVPTLPFILQIEMLRFLSNKHIGCIFASSDMAVGINYSLRSVLICSPTDDLYKYPLAFRLQMEGRCGRRGKDTEGHIIYWNVEKDEEELTDMEFLKPVSEFKDWKETFLKECGEYEKTYNTDIMKWVKGWRSSIGEKELDYFTKFMNKEPYPKFNSMERFEIMTYFRTWLSDVQELYYYTTVHYPKMSDFLFMMYNVIRKFIHSLKIFE